MPTPRAGETRKEFVRRCIPIVIDDGTAADGSQANAICNSIWEDSKKMTDEIKARKKERDGMHPASHYLVVEDPQSPSTWHLRVKDVDGSPNPRLMGAAWAALHGGYRGNTYQGPDKEKAISKLRRMYSRMGRTPPGKSTVMVKSMDDDIAIVVGYGIIFGGKDLEGETFTPDTELMLDYVPVKSIFYDHTLDQKVSGPVGMVKAEEPDEYGVWLEAQLDRSKEYVNAVLDMIEKGVIGFSSGTVGHLARRDGKTITRWPVVEYSLTPTPAEPRTLGVSQIKALFESAGLEVPEAFNEADEANAADEPAPIKEKPMEEREKQPEVKAVDTGAIAAEVLKAIRAEQAAEAEAKAKREEERKAMRAELRAELEAEIPAWKGGFFHNKIQHDDPNDDGGLDSFNHYLKTGDAGYAKVMKDAAVKSLPFWKSDPAVKAALQGQTDAEGGYLVPDDFYNQIVAKRDDMSIIRRAGARVIQTSLDRVLIPTEGTSLTAHAITAEEAAVDEEEPTFGQAIAVVYKATKLIKVSEELVADEAAGLQPFLGDALSRAEAAWENYYFVSTGTGTGQPQSALAASSAAVTAAGTNTVTAAEVKSLLFGLGGGYAESPNAAIVSRRATMGVVAALTGNPFSFAVMPSGDISSARGQMGNVIDGIPYYSDETMPALATGAKVMLFGDWNFYFVAERMGSMIQRLNELYAGNGQVGFLHKFRRGGVVGQSEAFVHVLTS